MTLDSTGLPLGVKQGWHEYSAIFLYSLGFLSERAAYAHDSTHAGSPPTAGSRRRGGGCDRSVGTVFRAPAIVVGRRQHPVLVVAPCGSTSLTVGWCVACGRIGTSGGGARDGNPCPALAWSRSIPPPTPGGGAAGFRRRAWGGVPLDAGGRGAAAHERFGVLERGVAPARDREAGESVRPRAAGLRRDIPPVRGNGVGLTTCRRDLHPRSVHATIEFTVQLLQSAPPDAFCESAGSR